MKEESGRRPTRLALPQNRMEKVYFFCQHGQLDALRTFLKEAETNDTKIDFDAVDSASNCTALMLASKHGHLPIVEELLFRGVQWNQLVDGKTAGDLASENGHERIERTLIDHGVRCELIMSTLMGSQSKTQTDEQNQAFLHSKLRYERRENGEVVLFGENQEAVMMEWEKDVMRWHRDWLFDRADKTKLTVLNIGFGLGIFDTLVQEMSDRVDTHVIIEAHPDVLAFMREEGWFERENVRIVEGRWQEVIHTLGIVFDAIFYDTYESFDGGFSVLHEELPNLLDTNGRYTYFNGVCGTNAHLHNVANTLVQLQLLDCGLSVEYDRRELADLPDGTWKDVERAYYVLSFYDFPRIKLSM